MKDLMMLYGVTLGKRYTKRQKEFFKAEIKETYTGLGYPVQIEQAKSRGFAGENILAGDFRQSDVVFAAAYDTPARSILPNIKYYPFHTDKNLKAEKLNLVVRLTILSVFALAVYLTLRLYYQGQNNILFLLTALVCITGTLAVIRTSASPWNFNLNSASLAVMGAVAKNLKDRQRAAFAFLDHGAESYEGLKALREVQETKDKTMIVLNCIASGKKLIVAHRAGAREQAVRLMEAAKRSGIELIDKEYNEEKAADNVLAFGELMLYVVSGTVEKNEFIVKNTKSKKDINVDMKRLEGIAQALTDFAENRE